MEDIVEKIGYIAIMIITIFIIIMIGVLIWILVQHVSYGDYVGTIIDKRYTPEHTYITTRTIYTGKTCTSIPVSQYESEKYEIKIEKEINSKKKSIWICITKEEYDKYQKGDFYGE